MCDAGVCRGHLAAHATHPESDLGKSEHFQIARVMCILCNCRFDYNGHLHDNLFSMSLSICFSCSCFLPIRRTFSLPLPIGMNKSSETNGNESILFIDLCSVVDSTYDRRCLHRNDPIHFRFRHRIICWFEIHLEFLIYDGGLW